MLRPKSIYTEGDPPSDLLSNQLCPEIADRVNQHLRSLATCFTGIYRAVKFRMDGPDIRTTAKLATLTSVHIIVTENICTAK